MEKEEINKHFFEQWRSETLVVQKWFYAQVLRDDITIEKMKELENLKEYNAKIPNLLRSLVGRFGAFNTAAFHAIDGSGYSYFGSKIIEVDKFNPQMASRFGKILDFSSKLDELRKPKLLEVLRKIVQEPGISNDLKEVIQKNLS